MVKLNNYVV